MGIIANPPPTWEETTLGEVCQQGGGDIQTGPFGSQLHASDYVTIGVPSVMPVNIGDNRILTDGICRITDKDAQRLSRYRLRTDDIVYSRRGDVERRALVREHEDGWLCGTGCLRVRLGTGKVNPLYASYYLGHPSVRQWIVQHAVGATMPNLNTGILSALPFLLPPLAEQHAIADILGSLDDKIELNRRTNETLEAMARAIFKSWFVDFDPVVAKSQGRQPDGMDAETARLFPSSFEDSEIGRVPKGWRVSKLSEVLELAYGKALKEEDRHTGMIPVFGSNGQVGWHDQRLVCGPGIVVGRKGNPGVVKWAPTDFFPIDTTFYVVPKDRSTSLRFLFFALVNQNLPLLGADSAVPGLNRNQAYMSLQVIPSSDLLQAFDTIVTPYFDHSHTLALESATIAATRDALLPRLLSGQLGCGVRSDRR